MEQLPKIFHDARTRLTRRLVVHESNGSPKRPSFAIRAHAVDFLARRRALSRPRAATHCGHDAGDQLVAKA